MHNGKDSGKAWHCMATDPVLEELGSSLQSGLSDEEAKARLGKSGPNELVETGGRGPGVGPIRTVRRSRDPIRNPLLPIAQVEGPFKALDAGLSTVHDLASRRLSLPTFLAQRR